MGSRRNFCSHPDHPVAETNGGRVKVVAAGVLKKIGFGTSIVLGFFIGSALEFIALEPMLLKSMEEEKLRLIRHEELIPFLPVFASMKRLARYNLGSVALGSLIVSFVESVRFILEAIRRRTKVRGTTPDHWFWRMAHYTSRGCLKSVEWTIKSVNRSAYIMIAITGKSFCKSSAIATELIISNILRIGKVNVIGDVILFLGKLCVNRCFLSLIRFACDCLYAHACWALGYIVATLFFAVVEMSIDTIILSFCQDSEENQGNAQHAPPLLLETLDSNQEEEVQRLTQ
ncbi:unnamed protein product [Arabidopsis halleri]